MCDKALRKMDKSKVNQVVNKNTDNLHSGSRVILTDDELENFNISLLDNDTGFFSIVISNKSGEIIKNSGVYNCNIDFNKICDIVYNIKQGILDQYDVDTLTDTVVNSCIYGFHWNVCITPTTVCINLLKFDNVNITSYVINCDDPNEAIQIKNVLINIVNTIALDTNKNNDYVSLSAIKKLIVNQYGLLIERDKIMNDILYKLTQLSTTDLKTVINKI